LKAPDEQKKEKEEYSMIGNFSVGKGAICFIVDVYQEKQREKEHLEK
jgi:hypothetical protein